MGGGQELGVRMETGILGLLVAGLAVLGEEEENIRLRRRAEELKEGQGAGRGARTMGLRLLNWVKA
jgi:hypothetical protein